MIGSDDRKVKHCLVGVAGRYFTVVCITVNIIEIYETKSCSDPPRPLGVGEVSLKAE